MELRYCALIVFAMCSSIANAYSSEDILSLIRKPHERTAQCRIECLKSLVAIKQDSYCQRHRSCKSCWDLCPKIVSDENEKSFYCEDNNENTCDEGCTTACKFIKQEPSGTVVSSTDISTNFIGCTLYWKTSLSDESIPIHQLYGMDDQV